jgi:lactoylglutathione lyase
MKIEHIAMWVNNLEEMKHFYLKYFDASANNKYINSKKGFESYFLSFTSGARSEIMHMSSIFPTTNEPSQQKWALFMWHFPWVQSKRSMS